MQERLPCVSAMYDAELIQSLQSFLSWILTCRPRGRTESMAWQAKTEGWATNGSDMVDSKGTCIKE